MLAMLKIAPQDALVKYMEVAMPQESWVDYLCQIIKDKDTLSLRPVQKRWWSFISPPQSPAFISRGHEKALKVSYLEAKLLKMKEINLSCIVLAILRDTDLEGKLKYKSAQNFIKEMI
jgi:hypothetical protein